MYNWNLKIHPQYDFVELDSSFDVWKLTAIAYQNYNQVKNLSSSSNLEQGCVYLVLCFNSQTGKYAVYTGQTRRSFKERFASHVSQGTFQKYVIKRLFIFTSKSLFRSIDNLMYFEFKFMQFVNDLKLLENINKQLGNDVSDSSPENNPEHDKCFNKMKLLLQFLEIIFLPILIFDECGEKSLFAFKGKRKNGGSFKGVGSLCKEDKFLILKESYTDVINFSFHNNWLNQRDKKILKKLLNARIIVQKNNLYVFQQDYLFTSPSSAAGFLCAKDTNGWTTWKSLKTSDTLDQICWKKLNTLIKMNF